jgi:putative phage-type endonuclease
MNAPARKAFLEERQTSIGGSDIAAILGMSKFSTPYDIWRSKVEPVEEEDESEKPYLYWGSVLEDVVAKEYALRTGYKIQRVNKKLVHPKHAFIAANIDRAVVNPEIAGNVRWKDDRLTTDKILECKTSNAFAAGDWGESGTDDVPLYYLIQCQWYLGVTGAETADLGSVA